MQNGTILCRNIDTPLGPMIAGATSQGCCLLEFHDRRGLSGSKRRLHERHGLDLTPGNNEILDQLANEIARYFDGTLRSFTVALDMRGTPFDLAVWNQLLRIPAGETRSYGELAARLGKPNGMRAVGTANGRNSIAIVVPCHRVVQANGTLGGYGGGLWRKEFLLTLEGAHVGSRTPHHPHTVHATPQTTLDI